jgi:hypothetical protein
MQARRTRVAARVTLSICVACAGSIPAIALAQSGDGWSFGDEDPATAPPVTPPPATPPPATPPPDEQPRIAPLVQPADDPHADTPGGGATTEPPKRPIDRRVLHGFRMGYLYIANSDEPSQSDDPDCPKCSMKERYDLRTPHQFLIGYEVMGRLIGHGWLNVVLVGNVLVSGLEQSKFWPSANALIGFELDQSFQVGVGANFTLEEEKPAHMVMAAGWTPLVGSFYVPVHAFFVPDVDGNHRMGATVGVNW